MAPAPLMSWRGGIRRGSRARKPEWFWRQRIDAKGKEAKWSTGFYFSPMMQMMRFCAGDSLASVAIQERRYGDVPRQGRTQQLFGAMLNNTLHPVELP